MQDPKLSARIAAIHERIAAAAGRAGRAPGEVTLVAVSKTQPPEAVAAAYAAGLRVFGENRVEEAGPKVTAVARLLAVPPLPPQPGGKPDAVQTLGGAAHPPILGGWGGEPPTWHMIGHVQSRKAEDVLPWAARVHSVDSEKLARRLSKAVVDIGYSDVAAKSLPILLEINVSGEASKDGVTPERAPALVETILALPGLRIEGLMTVAPIAADPEDVRPVFAALRRLRNDLAHRFPAVDWRHLSMGMTDDFEVAIEEGATMVRVGRAIFGERT
ncbi:MAG: YggS family pyridoxal phosphate-dependent enzyme [Chloroflexi bacterium]|nr:YggS family pyridoxal phosphate-dependent enzyme [Chloroflexota bacterium]